MTLVVALAILLLTSCNYGHRQYRSTVDTTDPASGLLVVEVDDFGEFWNRDMAEATRKTIEAATEGKNTIVVVFIHGWHHNADESDPNFKNFKNSIDDLRDKLAHEKYVEVRKDLKVKEDIQVLGLYVGWRGRSLPSVFDYLTFWGRKSAAERVGDGDLREFFAKLQKVYMDRNNASQADEPTFMGLVTVGHSFGGQVLFKAITHAFEEDLISAVENADKSSGTSDQKYMREIVSGLGDLTVLLNPALEAFQYERIDRLTRAVSFLPSQSPVILTVSAEDDSARKVWFPIARNLNFPFRANFPSDEVKELWKRALGVYEPQQTHTLRPTDPTSHVADSLDKDCTTIRKSDLSGSLRLKDAELEPIVGRKRPYSPVLVAYTNRDLVQEHNGIFGATFGEFLTDYVALVQAKRMCLIREQQRREATSARP
jgi:hypothetical protein